MKRHDDEKKGLILGGTCELALCLAPMLIAKEIVPVLTFRSEEGQRRIEEKLAPYAGHYETVRLDLNDTASIEAFFSRTSSSCDFLVDFAQSDYEAFIAGADESRIYSYFMENVAARAVFLKHVTLAMLGRRRGRLVYVSSSAAERPAPGQGFYSASSFPRPSTAIAAWRWREKGSPPSSCGWAMSRRDGDASFWKRGRMP